MAGEYIIEYFLHFTFPYTALSYISVTSMNRTAPFSFLLLLGLLVVARPTPAGAQEERPAGVQYLRSFLPKADTLRIRQLLRTGTDLCWENPDSALQLLGTAEQLSLQAGYTDGAAQALTIMSHVATGQGRYAESYAYYDKARLYCMVSTDKSMLPRLYSDIATTYLLQSNYLRASWYYFEALHLLMHNGMGEHPGILTIYANLAYLQTHVERYEQALFYLEQAEQIARRKNYQGQLGFILNNKGEAYYALKQPAKAMACYLEGLEKVRNDTTQSKHRNLEIEQSILTSLAQMMIEQKKPREAIRHLERARGLSSGTNPYFSSIFPGYLLGEAYRQLGEYQRAESSVLPALQKAETLGFRESMTDALQTLAGIYEATGRDREALQRYRQYAQLKDSATDREKTQAINRLEIRYRTAQKDKQLAEKELLITRQNGALSRQQAWILVSSLVALLLTALSLLLLVLVRNNQHRQKLQAERIRTIEHEKERIEQEKNLLQRDEEIRMMQALIRGEERERARLARELHDGIGGMIAAVQMHFSAAQHREDPDEREKGMQTITDMLEKTAREIRKTAHNLMPDVVLRHSFGEALQLFCNQVNAAGRLRLDLQVHEQVPAVPKPVALSLYRIVQELVHNIIRHSGADEAVVQVRQQEGLLRIMIEDNGRGFETGEIPAGMGLHNLQSRVKALRGFISIESSKGTGTTVCLEFDIPVLQKDTVHEDHDRYRG